MNIPNTEFINLLMRGTPSEGVNLSFFSGVRFLRFNQKDSFEKVYSPMPTLVVVAQGKKKVRFQSFELTYDPRHYFLMSSECHYSSQIFEASKSKPYLAIGVALPPEVISEVFFERGFHQQRVLLTTEESKTAFVNPLKPRLLEPVMRLANCAQSSDDSQNFADLIVKEIIVHLFLEGAGSYFAELFKYREDAVRLQKALLYMKSHYSKKIRIESLAKISGMSPSHFAHRFSKVVGMSPMKYLKSLRLTASARLMGNREYNVSEVADMVGYQSLSHFVHDFKRFYGTPPSKYQQRLET